MGPVRAIVTTKIYCRPLEFGGTRKCSGRPKSENVREYPSAAAARADGYRACKVCLRDD